MDLQAEKLELLHAVFDIEDISLIKEVKELISKHEESRDWFDDFTDEQDDAIVRSLEKLDKGEGIPHEEAVRRLGL